VRLIVVCVLLVLILGGCGEAVRTSDAPTTPAPVRTYEPISLIVTPTPWGVSPLPTAEAARVFVWPSNGRPSLLFIYDDSAT
jgi:uncharacterized protein YceK